MNINADVAFLGEDRLARVEAHPHTHRPSAQRNLRFLRGRDRIRGTSKGHEEGISLRVDLDAAVARNRVPEQAPVLGQHLCIPVPQLMQEPRRALDVGEEKGDGS